MDSSVYRYLLLKYSHTINLIIVLILYRTVCSRNISREIIYSQNIINITFGVHHVWSITVYSKHN